MRPKTPNRKFARRSNKPRKKPPRKPAAAGLKRSPDQTFKEAAYLKHLADSKIRILVRTWNNEEFAGWIEYYDNSFIRLSRPEQPNVFLFKRDIKYFHEQPQ